MAQMGMPGMPGMQGPPQPSSDKNKIPKLFSNDQNSVVLRSMNGIYKLFYIVRRFTGKFLWTGSCSKTLILTDSNVNVLLTNTNTANERLGSNSIEDIDVEWRTRTYVIIKQKQ